ncbi:MAG: NADP-dependent methylenetetrahydromethanopterin/methylenetetrahydrofolate dehydrogenase [Gammaproteobacteria bacterium]
MKKLLFQFDTDPHPSVFDAVVAYDGGADHVIGHPGCTPDMIQSLVEGTIFTRSESNKKYTAIFIGGSNVNTGDALLEAVKKQFFGNFRVSVMLDCNGCNTTAAAAVASMLKNGDIKGKKAVILAGTGPVGSRAAVMLSRAGAKVAITSRNMARSKETCQGLQARFGVDIEALEATTREQRAGQIEDANIVFATGAAGVQLLDASDWLENPNIEIVADANAVPPAGIGGVGMTDRGKDHNGKIVWGPIGFGPAKLTLQRHCVTSLFGQNDLVLDADEIFNLARKMI